jgi:integrase
MTTRTEKTEEAYRKRAARLANAARKKAGGRRVSPAELAQNLIARRPELAPSTFRQNRAAITFMMNEVANDQPALEPETRAVIAMLKDVESVDRPDDGVPRTSAQKQKRLDDDLDRICHGALATTSPNARALVDCLTVGSLTGARLVEWPTAEFGPSDDPDYEWQLVLVNGKQGNGRAHGETRVLRWEWLPEELVSQTKAWIFTACEAAVNASYETLIATLESLMRRLTKLLFPRRQRRPTLSSARHAAVARWKMNYVVTARSAEDRELGLAIVAALLGHASDETATKHYARAGEADGRFPTPTPDPAEVARVRQRYSAPTKERDSLKPK